MKEQNELEKIQYCARKTSIGGQALMEGIMMKGPKKTAIAVRNPEGEIVMEEIVSKPRDPKKFNVMKIPIVRGVFAFASSMALGYKCLMRSAEISALEEIEAEMEREKKAKKEAKKAAKKAKKGENAEIVTDEPTPENEDTVKVVNDDEKTEKENSGSAWYMTLITILSAVLGIVLALVLFMWLPTQLFHWLSKAVPALDNRFFKSLFEGIIKLLIMIAYMLLVSQMKDIKRTFMFHGAEHKTIFCYESGLELTVENVRGQRRFHPRCGTSFLIIMILIGIFVSFFIPPTWNPILRTAVKILLLPVTMGIGYEFLKLAGRHDNIITRFFSAPGLWFQRITVLEPDDSMIECAIVAMKQVIPDDESDKI